MPHHIGYCFSKSFKRALKATEGGDNHLSLERLHQILQSFLSGGSHGLNSELLRNTGALKIWSLRVNGKNRILLTMTTSSEGKKRLILLDYMCDHNYQANTFLRDTYTQRYLSTYGQALPEYTELEQFFQADSALEQHSTAVQLQETAFNEVLEQLSEEQQEALNSPSHSKQEDKIFVGPPGSGKTLLLLAELRQQIDYESAPETPPFLYITQSPQLANAVSKQLYFEELEDWVQVRTLAEAQQRYAGPVPDPAASTESDRDQTIRWINAQKSIGIETERVAQEFQALTADLLLEDYMKRGERQSHIPQEKREAVLTLFQRFIIEYPHIANPVFTFPATIQQVVYDEAQDAPLRLLVALRKGFTGRLLLAGDNRQRFNDELSATVDYLNLYKQQTRTSEFRLSHTYRCPPAVACVANALTTLLKQESATLDAPTKDLGTEVHSLRMTSAPAGIRCLAREQLLELIAHLQRYNNTLIIVASQERHRQLQKQNPYGQPVHTALETRGLEFKLVILDGLLTQLVQTLQAKKRSIETVKYVFNTLFTAVTRCEHQLVFVEQDWNKLRGLLSHLNLTESCFTEPLVQPEDVADSSHWMQIINTLIEQPEHLALAERLYVTRLQEFYPSQSFEQYKSQRESAVSRLKSSSTRKAAATAVAAVLETPKQASLVLLSEAQKAFSDKRSPPKQGVTASIAISKNKKINEELVEAIDKENFKQIITLIRQGADVNTTDREGFSLLSIAAQKGHAKIVQALLTKGANINTQCQDSRNALMVAAQEGHDNIVQTLLDNGANINIQAHNDGATALILAAQEGHADIVQALLAKGADINTQAHNGNHALRLAAQKGHANIVQALLTKGANINTQCQDGSNALMVAAQEGHDNIVQTLLDNGANINTQAHNDGATALILAAQEGHVDIVQTLLAKGADINIQTLDSATAFTLLNTNNSKNDSKIQELFLSHADKLLAIQAQNNNDHDASLMVACRDGNLPNVERLLEQQANIDAQSSLGRTPLMFATKHNQKDVVEFLLDQGANPVLIDHRKQPALRYTDNKEIKLLILTNIKAKIKK